MDTNTNILQAVLNIDSYLNLKQFGQSGEQANLLQDGQEAYDDIYASKIGQQQILLHGSTLPFKTRSSTLGSDAGSLNTKRTGKQATAKYREKRKKYVKELQHDVKKLETQIANVQSQVKSMKDSILVKLETQIKAVHSSENAQIFNELQNCLNKTGQDEQLIDIDKLNLLLNTLKYRIGPSGRERQAKLQYNFKNIVNTWFPGLHRYFLVTATQKLDIFKNDDVSNLNWTQQLLKKMNLTPQQIQNIRKQEQKITKVHTSTLQKIETLQKIKRKMRDQALLVDNAEDQIREHMNPIQCAKWTTFCEKYKYRKDISLDEKFRPRPAAYSVEEQMEGLLEFKLGRKMVRLDKS